MIVSEFGHVDSADFDALGDTLSADAAAAATILQVTDTADFDEDGGHLLVDGTHLLEYSTCDGDPESADPTITLIDALPAAASEGARVDLWDPFRAEVVTEMIATVHIDGDDEGELVECVVEQHLVDRLPVGPRGTSGESVRLEAEDGEWRVVDILGGAGTTAAGGSSTMQFHNTDAFALATDGDQDITLTHLPIEGSCHVYQNGLQQRRNFDWTRVGKTVSLTGSHYRTLDIVDVEYASLQVGTSPGLHADVDVTTAVGATGGNFQTEVPAPAAGDLVVVFMTSLRQPPRQVTDVTGLGATWVKVFDGADPDTEHTIWFGTGATSGGGVTATLDGVDPDCYLHVFFVSGLTAPAVIDVAEAVGSGMSMLGPTLEALPGQVAIAAGYERFSDEEATLTFPLATLPAAGWTDGPSDDSAAKSAAGSAYRAPATTADHRCDVAASAEADLLSVVMVVIGEAS